MLEIWKEKKSKISTDKTAEIRSSSPDNEGITQAQAIDELHHNFPEVMMIMTMKEC
jgi:hypothetical protein